MAEKELTFLRVQRNACPSTTRLDFPDLLFHLYKGVIQQNETVSKGFSTDRFLCAIPHSAFRTGYSQRGIPGPLLSASAERSQGKL